MRSESPASCFTRPEPVERRCNQYQYKHAQQRKHESEPRAPFASLATQAPSTAPPRLRRAPRRLKASTARTAVGVQAFHPYEFWVDRRAARRPRQDTRVLVQLQVKPPRMHAHSLTWCAHVKSRTYDHTVAVDMAGGPTAASLVDRLRLRASRLAC